MIPVRIQFQDDETADVELAIRPMVDEFIAIEGERFQVQCIEHLLTTGQPPVVLVRVDKGSEGSHSKQRPTLGKGFAQANNV